MTIVNMHPPMPHPQHGHAPVHQGERPYAVYNPAGPDHLADYVNQLHIHQNRQSPSNEARSRDLTAGADINEDGEIYLGYTFYKANPPRGRSTTWKAVDKAKMNLSQNDLLSLVQKRARKLTSTDQYQSLSMVKRPHVDQLIEDLRHTRPQFHWTCIYVKEEQRDARGKNRSRGDYETTSMDVILMGKATHRPSPGAPVQVRVQLPPHVQHATNENIHRPFAGAGPHAGPWTASAWQQAPMPPQMPAQVPPVQQGPAQFWQHTPHPQSHGPPQNVMKESQYPEQAGWQQNIPRSQPQPTGPVVQNYINQPPVPDPSHEVHDHGVRKAPIESKSQSHSAEKPQPNLARHHQPHTPRARVKSPKQRPGSEPDLVYDSTSSGDDVVMPREHYDDDSEAEFSSRDAKTPRYRGSLYPATKPGYRYRTHYRKDPDMIGDHELRRYRDSPSVDIVPASSRHLAGRANKRHGGVPQWTAPTPIIHHQSSSDEVNLLMEQVRGRAQNDVRSRMLTHWQADLEEREQLMEYQKHILKENIRNDRGNEMDLVGRSGALRESMPAYHRGYLPRAFH
ncbi:hypothetical protein BJX70DRAFT_210417 [Aspergillus crustosus]